MSSPSTIFTPGLPKYRAIAQHYEEAIAAGEYAVGDQLPPERELAAKWSITPMTVRQALDVLREKQLIVRKQGHGTFIAAPPAVAPEASAAIAPIYLLGMTPTQSALLRRVNWQPRMRRFQGMVDTAFRHGIRLNSNLELAEDMPAPQLIRSLAEAGGLILHDEVLPEVVLAGLAEAGVPMVAINCYLRVDYCNRLLVDSRRGALSAVRHLAELGHERIGLIVGELDRYSMGLREAGYRDAHELLGLPLNPAYTVIEPCGLEEDAVAACRTLLALPDPPTAIFAASDRRAMGIVEAADALGIRIPDDLSIVGFDDLAESASLDPPLTTLHNPLYESGEQAIELLLKLIHKEAQPNAVTLLPARLEIRGTTAPPPN